MEKEYIFSFVILNYLTTQDTIECVNSIKKFCTKNKFKIIIVDNASPNHSGQILMEMYKNDDTIKVFVNKENMGFAKGNNVGFKYAKEEIKSDFIVLCNSDTELLSDDFCSSIICKYEKSRFALMGPKEKLLDGSFYKLKEKARSKRELTIDLKYYKNIIEGKSLFWIRIIAKLNSFLEKKRKLDVSTEYENIFLHGAFLIFSKQYSNLFDGLNDSTFLYGEEEFLYWRLQKNNLLSIYYPKIEILHKRNHATNALLVDEVERKIRKAKWHLDSTEKLLSALNGENDI